MNGTLQSLLKSYQQEPGFPFIDWTTNHHSFFRLINFWDEVFQISAGEKITDYVAAQKVAQDSFSPILFVRNANETKKIRIWHGLTTDGQPDVAFFWSRYPDMNRPDPGGRSYSTTLENVYMLEIACDFDINRLQASAAMIHDFIHSNTGTATAQAVLEQKFEDQFRPYFPVPEVFFDDDD